MSYTEQHQQWSAKDADKHIVWMKLLPEVFLNGDLMVSVKTSWCYIIQSHHKCQPGIKIIVLINIYKNVLMMIQLIYIYIYRSVSLRSTLT